MRAALSDAAYAAGWQAVRRAPEPVARASFRLLADQIWRARGAGIRQLERNLSRVAPDADDEALRELSRKAMHSYLRYWCEAFRLPTWSRTEMLSRIVVHDEARFREYRARGSGLIAVLGHFGNWDHCGAWAAGVGMPFTTVAERLHPESLYNRFVAYRETLGMDVLPLTGDTNIADTLRQRLDADAFVALLADRNFSNSGIDVDLLGEPARFPAGPALLALRTGATLMPAISWYDDERTHLEFRQELVCSSEGSLRERVASLTQQFADVVGGAATEHPTDWHMLQRVWNSDVDRPS